MAVFKGWGPEIDEVTLTLKPQGWFPTQWRHLELIAQVKMDDFIFESVVGGTQV